MPKWKQIYSLKTSFVCPYCLKIYPTEKATIDHINPFSRSHDDSQSNKVICCKKCNEEKGALTAEEYKIWKQLNNIRNGVTRSR